MGYFPLNQTKIFILLRFRFRLINLFFRVNYDVENRIVAKEQERFVLFISEMFDSVQ